VLDADWLDRMADAGPLAWAAVLAAPFVGSFLGVVVRRLPEGAVIAWSRSCCESCGAVLRPCDLLPLVSWLLLRGRCRYCTQPIDCFHPAIELACVAIAVAALAVGGAELVWLDCVFGWWLLTLGWIDWRSWLLPDALTLPLILAGLAAAAVLAPIELIDRALGAALGYLGLRAVEAIYRRWRGRDGLGRGDAKLLAAIGAWVGVAALPQVLLIAAFAGLLAALAMRICGIRMTAQSALPFGPFLALGAWLVWLGFAWPGFTA
jgi:leader peptidase (prepilin peptidase)/N-methyltransferase